MFWRKKNKEFKPEIPAVIKKPLTVEEEEKMHRDELIRRVKAMDEEELALIVNYIPINMIMDRVYNEIREKREIEVQINNLTKMIGGKIDGLSN